MSPGGGEVEARSEAATAPGAGGARTASSRFEAASRRGETAAKSRLVSRLMCLVSRPNTAE
eukprot:scaffold2685_cov101-Isochrysis_galbana.AAC.7